VRPICLPLTEKYKTSLPVFGLTNHEEEHHILGEVAGFGKTENEGESSKVLQAVHVPFITNKDCQRIYNGKATITPKQVIYSIKFTNSGRFVLMIDIY